MAQYLQQHSEPIAILTEKRFERKGTFRLFADFVDVKVKTLQSDVETTIPLIQFSGQATRGKLHTLMFYVGFWCFICGVGALMVIAAFELQGLPLASFMLVMIPIGAAIIIFNHRKVQVLQFHSKAGVPLLGVTRTKSNSEEFEQFVSLLQERIQIVQQQSEHDSASNEAKSL